MKAHSSNKYILLITTISFLSTLLIFQNPVNSEEKAEPQTKQENITAKRASKIQDGINFCLTVIPGDKTQKTIAIVSMTNMTDKEVIVPTPKVMPLSGTIGHTNTIEIRKEARDKLSMTGLHADFLERPTTTLRVHPSILDLYSRSWLFELETNFPDLGEQGEYIIDFRLTSKPSKYNKATWEGTVDLSVSINKGGPYEIEQITNIQVVSVSNRDVLTLSVDNILQILKAVGFSNSQIQEYGFSIRDGLSKSGAVRVLIDDVVEAFLAVRGDEVFISTRNRGYFIYNIKTGWTNMQR